MRLSPSIKASSLLGALLHCRMAVGANNTVEDPTLPLSSDTTMNFDILTPLGMAITGGADIGPILGVAKNIIAGDMTSFTQEFYALANYTKAQAENPDNAYDPINVRDTWFSAANYFRKADNYLHGNWSEPLVNSLWAEQTAAFDKGIAALPIPGERVRIPATKGNFTVDAIWYAASDNKNAKLPTLVIGNGFDAAQEDSYHNYVAPALARGWNCITYEGPGQPTVRRDQNLGFIPEWELVVTPVVDYLFREKLHVIDTDRLALVGNSLGSYLASRAAAFEHRFSALVLIDGMWDYFPSYANAIPAELLGMFEAGNFTEFDQTIFESRESGKLSTIAGWGLDQGLWAYYTHSPSDLFTKVKQYRIQDFVDKIKIPVFVGDGEYDSLYPGQPQQVKDALGEKATLHHFNGVAGYHCQTAAGQELARAMFAWLNKTLSNA